MRKVFLGILIVLVIGAGFLQMVNGFEAIVLLSLIFIFERLLLIEDKIKISHELNVNMMKQVYAKLGGLKK